MYGWMINCVQVYVCIKCMDVWMNEYMQICIWMTDRIYACTYGWINRRMYVVMYIFMYVCVNEWMDGLMDGWLNVCESMYAYNVWMYEWLIVCMHVNIDE